MTSSPADTDRSLAEQALLAKLPEWRISGQSQQTAEDQRIQRTFHFDNYADALQFTASIGALADQYKHYPTIITAFKKVTVFWSTVESHPEEAQSGKTRALRKKILFSRQKRMP